MCIVRMYICIYIYNLCVFIYVYVDNIQYSILIELEQHSNTHIYNYMSIHVICMFLYHYIFGKLFFTIFFSFSTTIFPLSCSVLLSASLLLLISNISSRNVLIHIWLYKRVREKYCASTILIISIRKHSKS